MIRHSYTIDIKTGPLTRQMYTFKVDTYGELRDLVSIKLMRWVDQRRRPGEGWRTMGFWVAKGENWPHDARRNQRVARPPVEAKMKDMVWSIIRKDIKWL